MDDRKHVAAILSEELHAIRNFASEGGFLFLAYLVEMARLEAQITAQAIELAA